VLNIYNFGTSTCTLTANDTNSSAGNRFLFPAPITLNLYRNVTLRYSSGAGGWLLWSQAPSRPAQGSFKNLRVLNVANALGDTAPATPNNQMNIFVDEIVVDDGLGNTFTIDQSYAYSCTVDLTVSGAGGLDTGTVGTNKWYFLYVIYSASANAPSCLASLSSTAPSMPAGYTFKARVGANQTDLGPHFYRVQQYGRIAHYVNVSGSNTPGPIRVQNGASGSGTVASPTYAALPVLGTGFVAPSTAVRLLMTCATNYLGGNGLASYVAPSTSWNGINPNNTPPPLICVSGGTVVFNTAWIDLEGTSIAIATNFSGGGQGPAGIANYVGGWEDNL
jgi:hypothetical protein